MPVLAEVVRSGFVESVHTGSVVAVGPDGSRLLAVGEPDRPVFPRSCNKPLQAAAAVKAGIVAAFGLDDRHLAVAAASHSGEPAHVDLVRDLLHRADVPESALGCPHALPLHEETAQALLARGFQPARVTHNCSGKHAAMLAACQANGWPVATYLDPRSKLQQAVRRTVERLAGEKPAAVGVDGCGAPLLALTLTGLAGALGRVARAAAGTPERRVADAMRAHPDLVGGTGRDVTAFMRAVPGLVAKDGAEGCYAAGTADGIGIAIKIDDGAARARVPVLAGVLGALGVPMDEAVVAEVAEPVVLGGGEPVGCVRLAPGLF